MITITPNIAPPNLGGQMRFPPPGVIQARVPAPQRPQFFQPFRAYRQGGSGPVIFDPEFDGKRLRKSAMRKTVDYNAAIIKMLESRIWQRDFRDRHGLHPDAMYTPELLPPSAYEDNPINAVTTRFVKTATNKMRCPIFCMAWTPEGRRLVTGASSGEFTLWNGLTFNFETILQAHESPVRTMVWSHNEMWMVTADHSGYVKYWQSNMNNVKMFLAHQEPIRGISFSASDSKFASCSDDGTVKIWDFYRCVEERTLRGHGADVKCVHWHPHKGLVISGSKDNQQPVKLWDPKTGNPLATIHAHKSTVMDIKWNDNGNWFVTASRDHLLKLFDIRNLSSEVQTFRGHKKESSSVAWHPVHEGLFCSGGSDGAILFWHVGADKEVGVIEQAHDSIVWTLAWHPMGHILCSGSNDHTSKFWTRNRPGDAMKDKYNLNTLNTTTLDPSMENDLGDDGLSAIPGMGPDDKVELDMDLGMPGFTSVGTGAIPGLEDLSDIMSEDKNKAQAKRVPYSKPIPKNFQAQWNDTGGADSDEDSRDEVDVVALLNQLLEHHPGVKPISQVEPEALYIYGKVLAVEPCSELAAAISEGGERLIKYIHSGAIKELEEVIPHYENEEGQTMPFIIHEELIIESDAPEKTLDAAERFPTLSELFPGYDFNNSSGYPMDGIKDEERMEDQEEEDDRRDNFRREGSFRQFRGEGGDFRHNRSGEHWDHERGDSDFREDSSSFREEGFTSGGRRGGSSSGFNRREGFRNDDGSFNRNEGGNFNRNDGGGFNRNEGRNFNRNEGGFNRSEGGGFNRNDGNFNRNEGGFNRNDGGFNRNEGNNFNNRNEGNNFNNRNEGGFNRNDGGFNRNEGGFNRNEVGFNRTEGGGFNNQRGGFNRNEGGGFNQNEGGFGNDQGNFGSREGGFTGRDNNMRNEGRFNNRGEDFGGNFENEYQEDEEDYMDQEDNGEDDYREDYNEDFRSGGRRFDRGRGDADRGPRGRGGSRRGGKRSRRGGKGRGGRQSGSGGPGRWSRKRGGARNK